MLREIKFRAFCYKESDSNSYLNTFCHGRMVDVDKIDFEEGTIDFVCPSIITDYPLEWVHLMQFTGFYDCDGKEIYEGDILHIFCADAFELYENGGDYDNIDWKGGIVTWVQYPGQWEVREPDETGKYAFKFMHILGSFFEADSDAPIEIKIIGNIYEEFKE